MLRNKNKTKLTIFIKKFLKNENTYRIFKRF